MVWQDELRRVQLADGAVLIGASFRGVPFLVESSDRSGGRRTITHEFPFRDDPVIDDQGRRARMFPITGYVLGDDYLSERDALISALEDVEGPGELVHPQFAATIRAICDTFTTNESRRDGGIARFTIQFKEAPPETMAPVIVDDLDSLAEAAALIALETVIADLETSYNAVGQPAFTTESLSDDASAIATSMGDLLAPVVDSVSELFDDANTAIQELASLQAEVALFVDDAVQLVRTPETLFERLADIIGSIAETARVAPREVYQALIGVYDTAAQPVAAGDTPSRVQERANQVALGGAMREQSLFAATDLIVDVEYVSIDDALADRGQLVDRLDAQILIATDAVYPRLVDVRAAVTEAVPGGEELARVTTVERRIATPSLVLSYSLFGSVDGEADILARNPTQQHPGFLLGELQVLSAI